MMDKGEELRLDARFYQRKENKGTGYDKDDPPPLLPQKNPTIATKADPIKDWVRGISAKRFNLLNFQDLLEK
jgi:hypothetical protein